MGSKSANGGMGPSAALGLTYSDTKQLASREGRLSYGAAWAMTLVVLWGVSFFCYTS